MFLLSRILTGEIATSFFSPAKSQLRSSHRRSRFSILLTRISIAPSLSLASRSITLSPKSQIAKHLLRVITSLLRVSSPRLKRVEDNYTWPLTSILLYNSRISIVYGTRLKT
ncbi:hypothetical protein RIF29_21256 [Crotalaria pallida]|uniref:Uncharacterized protein n=1 Tax=Crotalaria pallida TaxID=3830 RepID=A0AAN9I9C2_CROPI